MCSIMEDQAKAQEGQDAVEVDASLLLAQLREIPTSELEATFRELDTLHNATGAHRLLILSVLDERDVGRDDGALDTVGWVTWTARLSQSRARALVKTARALRDRPEIMKVALEGRLSGEQLDAVVQVATPETDEAWAHESPAWSASSLRAAARNQRTVSNDEAISRDRGRELSFRWDKKRGALRLRGWIPDADGALVEAALTRGADQAGPGADGQWDSFPARCADVLVGALNRELADDAEPHRATVLLHTPESAHQAESTAPGAYLDAGDDGIPIANETARRLSCDAIRQIVVEDAAGVPLRLGRRTRSVPPHIYRLLKHRDRHCRAPGCNRTRGLHAHHRKHWIDGGTTDLDNLVLLCTRHHRLLHEQGWQICGDLQRPESIEFRHRDGRTITPYRPPPLSAGVRERILVSTS
jgi:hypothetical protein